MLINIIKHFMNLVLVVDKIKFVDKNKKAKKRNIQL